MPNVIQHISKVCYAHIPFQGIQLTQVSYRFLALGCFPANLVSDEKEQKTEDRDGQFVY